VLKTFKRLFLVDFENVHLSGIKGISSLDDEDEVYIFCSDSQKESVAVISELCPKARYIKIFNNCPNALDFQLASYLGYTICQQVQNNAEVQYFLISKDTGFSVLETFWTQSPFVKNQLKLKLQVKCAKSIFSALNPVISKGSEETKSDIDSVLYEDKNAEIYAIMGQVKDYSDLHTALVKKYKTPLGNDLYKKYKDKFKELKGLK
jgi:hypothetical protein